MEGALLGEHPILLGLTIQNNKQKTNHMDIKEIQGLIKFVAKSGASEVKLEMEDFKITIKTGASKTETTIVQAAPVTPVPQAVPAVPMASAPVATPKLMLIILKLIRKTLQNILPSNLQLSVLFTENPLPTNPILWKLGAKLTRGYCLYH